MITTPPEHKYDEQMLDILKNGKTYEKWSDGEKSIFYDLAHYIQKYTHFNWEDISLDYLLYNISVIYDKCKNTNAGQLYIVANMIDNIFPNLIADVVENGERIDIIVKDISGNKLNGG